jgi:pimeloyl-ACP methyl ester carboxylesterase
VSLVGASYGSAVALNLAARYPGLVDRVVCIEGGALILPEVLNYSRLGALLEWPVLGDLIWAFMRSGLFDRQTARSLMGPAWAGLSPARRDEITAVIRANIGGISRASWAGIYRAITGRIDFTAALQDSGLPVLYVYGEASRYRAVAEMNAERLGRLGLQSRVVAVAGGVHDLHLQDPAAVTGLILRFLQGDGLDWVAGRGGLTTAEARP